ncbi:MAG: hypothetical protein PHS53_04635 [Candidatus Pacebacteria bacterium]|nr:hypothetical protein [Candidatus Paceibacterota bacterium]MDD5357405.1 hypothetical protein [Candidatus Paceibacterota bacterium]
MQFGIKHYGLMLAGLMVFAFCLNFSTRAGDVPQPQSDQGKDKPTAAGKETAPAVKDGLKQVDKAAVQTVQVNNKDGAVKFLSSICEVGLNLKPVAIGTQDTTKVFAQLIDAKTVNITPVRDFCIKLENNEGVKYALSENDLKELILKLDNSSRPDMIDLVPALKKASVSMSNSKLINGLAAVTTTSAPGAENK